MFTRSFVLLLLLLATGWAVQAQAGQHFPYRAYIKEDGVSVRSGPGEDYYASLELPRGQYVDVYRHDPGGWCAIRPPAGSFSWISGKYLELEDDRIAKVIGNHVAVRVGSSQSTLRDVIQVRLDQGEKVEVLESRRLGGSEGEIWYKIAPPAGEFRWVSKQFLDLSPPEPVAVEPPASADESDVLDDAADADLTDRDEPLTSTDESYADDSEADYSDETPRVPLRALRTRSRETAEPRRLRSAPRAARRVSASSDRVASRRRRDTIDREGDDDESYLGAYVDTGPDDARYDDLDDNLDDVDYLGGYDEQDAEQDVEFARYEDYDSRLLDASPDIDGTRDPAAAATERASMASEPAPQNRRFRRWDEYVVADSRPAMTQRVRSEVDADEPPPSGDPTVEYDQIEWALSKMMARDTAEWEFQTLQQRAENLHESAESALDRARARALCKKISRLAEIQARHDGLALTQSETSRRNRQLALAIDRGTLDRPDRDAGPRYDGAGRLTRVLSREVGTPPYALLDDEGSVRYYVSPAPGVNLKRYEGQQVGVIGTIGFLPAQKAQHVTVKQIIETEGPLTR